MGLRDKFREAKERGDAYKAGRQADLLNNKLIADLGSRGEKQLAQNLQDGENILAKVKGDFGQGFVVTDKHVFIVKWGFQSGSTFGGKCVAYSYPNITAIQMKQQALKGLVQVLTAATADNNKLSYWGGRGNANNALESDSAITFDRQTAPVFQAAVNLAKRQMEQPSIGNKQSVNSIDKLKALRDEGVLTDDEYKAKVRGVLGLK
ncbi:MAG TPA: hypothetical protein VH234_05485 [Candidatus Saccharimonadales bacterium]|jgi:hypothetical protein|nr:hypothetical protein [Candidatus Saccharimonadales bacterium]